MTEQNNELIQIPVDMRIPVVIPSKAIVESTTLSDEDNILIEAGFMTKDEAVAFYNYSMLMSAIAGSRTEFLGMYRGVTEAYNRQKSGLLLPANVSKSLIIQ